MPTPQAPDRSGGAWNIKKIPNVLIVQMLVYLGPVYRVRDPVVIQWGAVRAWCLVRLLMYPDRIRAGAGRRRGPALVRSWCRDPGRTGSGRGPALVRRWCSCRAWRRDPGGNIHRRRARAGAGAPAGPGVNGSGPEAGGAGLEAARARARASGARIKIVIESERARARAGGVPMAEGGRG